METLKTLLRNLADIINQLLGNAKLQEAPLRQQNEHDQNIVDKNMFRNRIG